MRERALFFGTPEIAVPALTALHAIADVVGVVCQPDRPAGRGLEMHAPAVKVLAAKLGLAVHQPTKIRTPEFAAWMQDQKADFALVLAYGRILPAPVLAAPARGCLNLHASILPRYRGAAPLNWCIVRGESTTGISLMQMDEGLDTGPVYVVRTLPIGENETAGELAPRMAELAAEAVRTDVLRAVRGELVSTPQVASEATLAPPMQKRDGQIDWNRPAREVHDHARGMTPWPGAFTHLEGKVLKILAARRSAFECAGAPPGTLVVADPDATLVACRDGTIEILRAQMEGRRVLTARDLVVGRTLTAGARLV